MGGRTSQSAESGPPTGEEQKCQHPLFARLGHRITENPGTLRSD